MSSTEKIDFLFARFLHLAQDILCDDELATESAQNACDKIKENFQDNFSILAAQKILDDEIEFIFARLVQEIKAGVKEAQNRLFNILNKRFQFLMRKKMYFNYPKITEDEANDIIQNALLTVYQKCASANPRGKFIQWAQTILLNKHKEYCRALKRAQKRITVVPEEYEPIYSQRMSEHITKRRSEKQVDPQTIDPIASNLTEQDVFANDPYDWTPSMILEGKDLKNCLLAIVKKMAEPCKSVFKILFSEGTVQAVHRQFPNLTRKQIDVMIFHCRQKLKMAAEKGSILS